MKTSEKISQNMNLQEEITVKNIDHLGLVAGLIDDLGIVEHINQLVGEQPGEIVSPGLAGGGTHLIEHCSSVMSIF